MRKVDVPRCFKNYEDDRICDLCHVSKECFHDKELKTEIKSKKCKWRGLYHSAFSGPSWLSCNNTELVEYDEEDKKWYRRYHCKPTIDCFPDIIRREKIRKLKAINEI